MPHRFGIGAGCASPVSKPKWKILVENTLLSVDVRSDPNHTPVGPWTPGPLRTKERSEISLFRGEERRGLQANHQRITNVLT
jgi:hypothetical protein